MTVCRCDYFPLTSLWKIAHHHRQCRRRQCFHHHHIV